MEETVKQPTYKRQRYLLSFIRQLEDSVTAIDLQKLVFLNIMADGSDSYEFVPYKYGAYSFQLSKDLDTLRKDGYLAIEGAPESVESKIRAIGEYPHEQPFVIASERGDSLIRKAYRAYPYYAINSEVLGYVFRGEELERFNKEKLAYATTKQVLFTIGYEGRSIEAFINLLLQNDIRLLCDVRKNPISRKFGFSKRQLFNITKNVGIKYAHIPDLGIETDRRRSLEKPNDYRRLFCEYEKLLIKHKASLDEVCRMLQTDNRVALMCYEKEPEMCHRHVIKDYLVKTQQIESADI